MKGQSRRNRVQNRRVLECLQRGTGLVLGTTALRNYDVQVVVRGWRRGGFLLGVNVGGGSRFETCCGE